MKRPDSVFLEKAKPGTQGCKIYIVIRPTMPLKITAYVKLVRPNPFIAKKTRTTLYTSCSKIWGKTSLTNSSFLSKSTEGILFKEEKKSDNARAYKRIWPSLFKEYLAVKKGVKRTTTAIMVSTNTC